MAVTVEDLILRIKAEGAQTLTQLNRSVKEAKDNLNGAIEVFGKGSKEADIFAQRLKNAQDKVQSFKDNVKQMGNGTKLSSAQLLEFGENVTIVATGLFNLVKGITQVTLASIQQGAKLKVLRENYKGTAEDLELLKKATAGTLTEEQLIPIFNKATEQLKLTTNETARLLAYSEDLADKGIGELTDNFNSLTKAVLTGGKGLNALGISQKQFKDDLKATATQLGINTGLIEDGNEQDEINISKLDAKTQKLLVLKTLFDGGYIPSLENVITKEQDSADKLEAVSVKLQEAKTEAGLFILNGIEPLIDGFLGLSKESDKVVGSIAGIGGALISVIPLIGSARTALQGLSLSTLGLYGAFITLAGGIVYAINKLDEWAVKKTGFDMWKPENMERRILQEEIANGKTLSPYNAERLKTLTTDSKALEEREANDKILNEVNDLKIKQAQENQKRQKEIDSLNLKSGLKTGNNKKDKEEELLTLDKILSNINEQVEANEKLFKLGDINAKQLDEAYVSAYNTLQANTALIDVTKKNISEEQRLLEIQTNRAKFREKEVELQNKSFSNTVEFVKSETFKKIIKSGLGVRIIGGSNFRAGLNATDEFRLRDSTEAQILQGQFDAQDERKQKAIEGVGNTISGVNTIFSILLTGTDNWASKVLSTFNDVVTAIQTVATIIKSIESVQSAISGGSSLLKIVGKFFGFASGGSVPGVGDTDSVPAMLTPGEVVIRKSAVNKYGADFFNSFNGGTNSISALGRYANGGIVTGGNSMNFNLGEVVFRQKGADLVAVVKAQNRKINRGRSKR